MKSELQKAKVNSKYLKKMLKLCRVDKIELAKALGKDKSRISCYCSGDPIPDYVQDQIQNFFKGVIAQNYKQLKEAENLSEK